MAKLSTTALARSDDPEQIEQCVINIGRSRHRLEVFESIYKGQKQKKTVSDLATDTGFSELQVRAALASLGDHHMCNIEGRGKNTFVTKDDFCRKYRDRIVRGVKDPKSLERLPTKRKNAVLGSPTSNSTTPVAASKVRKRSARRNAAFSIAFLTTNPHADLRTDVEYRAVKSIWRESENREQIEIENVSAASIEDFLRVLNNFQPQVVHFSGHGNAGLVLFDSNVIYGNPVEVDFDLLRSALEATQHPPQLVVLNSCFGAVKAAELIGSVEAVVGMNNSIDDAAAAIFAQQFYAGLFGGQPVDKAMEQGKIVLRAVQLKDADFPTLTMKDGVDASSVSFGR